MKKKNIISRKNVGIVSIILLLMIFIAVTASNSNLALWGVYVIPGVLGIILLAEVYISIKDEKIGFRSTWCYRKRDPKGFKIAVITRLVSAIVLFLVSTFLILKLIF